jgi:HlyD family secretion protein
VALARLEPASGLIAVGVRPGTRIDQVRVQEGDQAAEGQVLAVLEGRGAAERQLALAKAQKTRADYQRSLRRQGLAIERAQSDRTQPARLEAAKKVADLSREHFKQASELFKQFGGTLKGKDRYDAEMALFQVQVQSIKADLDQHLLEAAIEAQPDQRSIENRQVGDDNPENQSLQLQIELASAGLRETEVRAPVAGRVLRLLAHRGEISAGILLEMGDVSTMAAQAEVYQSDLARVHLGDPAEVKIQGIRVAGKVTRISSVIGKNQLTNVDPRALRDLRVAVVTIQLDDSTEAARYVNMEVEAELHPAGAGTTSEAPRSGSALPAPR